MLKICRRMIGQNQLNSLILTDLLTIINKIPDSHFIQAILHIRPFKPEFLEIEQTLLPNPSISTMSSRSYQQARFSTPQYKKQRKNLKISTITQQTLFKQFNQKYHPFNFILKNYLRLLELKCKSLIDNEKADISKIQIMLKQDLNTLTQFFKAAAIPYKIVFKVMDEKQENQINSKLNIFISQFVSSNENVNVSLKKIMIYGCRKIYERIFLGKIPDYVTPEQYDIPNDFQIDGCYIRSINTLMNFTLVRCPESCLEKFVELRENILKDINEYYRQENGKSKELQVCAEVQIQIIRFIVAKLKGWAVEIYAQLKLLQLIYGEEDIAFKFEEASFIYAQITLAFQILLLQQQQQFTS